MKTLVASIFILLSLFACGGDGSSTPAPEQLTITGALGDLGIFDPSVTRDPTTGRLWMSYSSVNSSPNYSSSVYWTVSLRLAYSDDNGVSWQDAGELSPAVERTDFGPMAYTTPPTPANTFGIWQSETSSLVYDPGAPAGEEWKLIWFQYLHVGQSSLYGDFSWIALKMAATPQGLVTATASKLFAGIGLQATNTTTTAPVFSPIGTAPAMQLNVDLTQTSGPALSELSACVFVEPGLLATNSTLYMSIYCADASTVASLGYATQYVVHFSCTSPCNITNAASWKYHGRLLTPNDAQLATGDNHFQAPALIEKNGKTYLTVTPVDTSGSTDRYNGCRVYEFVDLNSNQLLQSSGLLVELARVDGDAGTHHGACDTYSGLNGGLLLSQLKTPGAADMFSIYKSQVSLP